MNVALLLAAGASTRLAANKLLHRIQGRPLVWHTAKRLIAATSVDVVVAVIRPGAAGVEFVLTQLGVGCVACVAADDGISASIAAGIRALPHGTTRLLVALGDQPVPTNVVESLFEADRVAGKPALVPLYRGQRGNPVLFRESMFSALARLEGDLGARRLLADMGSEVAEIETGIDVPPDLDSEADVATLEAYLAGSGGTPH